MQTQKGLILLNAATLLRRMFSTLARRQIGFPCCSAVWSPVLQHLRQRCEAANYLRHRLGSRPFSSHKLSVVIPKRTDLDSDPKHQTLFVHPRATLIGNVSVGLGVNIWPGVVIRGARPALESICCADANAISIGDFTNIQDNSVVHCTGDWESTNQGFPTKIGARVSIGHLALLHGCTIHDDVLIGMMSTIMDGAVIPSFTIVGAHSLVPPGKVLEEKSLYVGSPVKRVRELREEEIEHIKNNCLRYIGLKNAYLAKERNTLEIESS